MAGEPKIIDVQGGDGVSGIAIAKGGKKGTYVVYQIRNGQPQKLDDYKQGDILRIQGFNGVVDLNVRAGGRPVRDPLMVGIINADKERPLAVRGRVFAVEGHVLNLVKPYELASPDMKQLAKGNLEPAVADGVREAKAAKDGFEGQMLFSRPLTAAREEPLAGVGKNARMDFIDAGGVPIMTFRGRDEVKDNQGRLTAAAKNTYETAAKIGEKYRELAPAFRRREPGAVQAVRQIEDWAKATGFPAAWLKIPLSTKLESEVKPVLEGALPRPAKNPEPEDKKPAMKKEEIVDKLLMSRQYFIDHKEVFAANAKKKEAAELLVKNYDVLIAHVRGDKKLDADDLKEACAQMRKDLAVCAKGFNADVTKEINGEKEFTAKVGRATYTGKLKMNEVLDAAEALSEKKKGAGMGMRFDPKVEKEALAAVRNHDILRIPLLAQAKPKTPGQGHAA